MPTAKKPVFISTEFVYCSNESEQKVPMLARVIILDEDGVTLLNGVVSDIQLPVTNKRGAEIACSGNPMTHEEIFEKIYDITQDKIVVGHRLNDDLYFLEPSIKPEVDLIDIDCNEKYAPANYPSDSRRNYLTSLRIKMFEQGELSNSDAWIQDPLVISATAIRDIYKSKDASDWNLVDKSATNADVVDSDG